MTDFFPDSEIERLRAEMPDFFELMADIKRQIAEAEHETAQDISRMSAAGFDREELDYRSSRGRMAVAPLRREFDAMTKKVVDLLTMRPAPPIALQAGDFRPAERIPPGLQRK